MNRRILLAAALLPIVANAQHGATTAGSLTLESPWTRAAGQGGQGHVTGQGGCHQHEQADEEGVQHARYRAAGAGADIGGSAGNSTGCRQASKESGGDIGNSLGDQLHIGTVAAAGHAVGDHG